MTEQTTYTKNLEAVVEEIRAAFTARGYNDIHIRVWFDADEPARKCPAVTDPTGTVRCSKPDKHTGDHVSTENGHVHSWNGGWRLWQA